MSYYLEEKPKSKPKSTFLNKIDPNIIALIFFIILLSTSLYCFLTYIYSNIITDKQTEYTITP